MKKKKVVYYLIGIVIILLFGRAFIHLTKAEDAQEEKLLEDVAEENINLSENVWKPIGLKVELMEEPYGIDTQDPAFSWYVNGKEDNVYQKMFQIVLANTMNRMNAEEYLVDTGWCETEENTYLKLDELKDVLDDNSVYYWKVRIMDTKENISEWSDVASFSTAVGSEWESTQGIWCKEQADYVFLRNEMKLEQDVDKIEKALLSVAALSPEETRQYVYNVYMNGEYVGSGPARLKNDEINYNTFDVTEYLAQNNVLGAICYTNTGKSFLCQLTVFYQDGTKEVVANSGSDSGNWRALDGDAAYGKSETMISTPYYVAHAENINAYFYPTGWMEWDYNDIMWCRVVVKEEIDQDSLVPYQTENMEKYYVAPIFVEEIEDGHYIVDLGKEIVGGISIDVYCRGLMPTDMILRYGEELDENGNVRYQMRTANIYEEKWTLKFGRQKYENIGMKTFRYIEIYADNITFTEDSIQGVALRQPFSDDKSYFNSSNELLNELYDLTKYTIQATNQNLYVDSQSRERGAYEGDAWINMMASYAFEDSYTLARVSNEYLYVERTWPAEYPMYGVMSAWQDYMYTGNIDSLRENYKLLRQNMESFQIDESYGLIKNDYGEDGFNRPLVDWPENERDGYAYDEAVYNTVVNAVACVAYKNLAQIAEALGDMLHYTEYVNISNTIKNSMIQHLYNEEMGKFSDGLTDDGQRVEHYTQHATTYALYAGIYVDSSMQNQIVESLKEDNQIKMSVFGAYFLLQGLYDNEAGDYATQLLLSQEDNDHTWAYMLKKNDATITTEAWSPQVKDNMTYSHAWGASPACFIVNGIFGIKPIKQGFEEFQIKIQPGKLENAEIKVPTIKGSIEVAYELKQNKMLAKIRIVVPSNTTAYVMLPVDRIEEADLLWAADLQIKEVTEKYYCISLTAGEYEIQLD